ncbi:UNVERIFIED_CONTAM: hypothetical protein K2H54_042095 [Gekko kuhli]
MLPVQTPPPPGQGKKRRLTFAQGCRPPVTTQLYTSLHQSRQAEAQARSHLEAQHGLSLAREAEAPEVDLETLAEELSHRLSTSVEASAYRKGARYRVPPHHGDGERALPLTEHAP